MGLIWSMQPSAPATDFYIWSPRAFVFALTAKVRGQSVASTTFQRMFSAGTISEQTESLGTNGFVGQLYSPIGLTAPQPAILLFGGSEGGLPGPLLPALLAGHGYSDLTLAYFKEPGLPQTLSNIPLDYFATALTWLSRRPYVDPKHIFTFGVSRGSEAAQLLGVYYPDLVHGVIALVPSDAAICSYPGCLGPAWTLHGRALAYTSQFDNPSPSDDPAAVIPVEKILGPVFMDCGGADQTWTSCPYANAIVSRLDANHDPYPHSLFAYADAGHDIGSPEPYEPELRALDASFEADQHARAQVWPELLAFLTNLARHQLI